ncbi:MAG: SDR family oxidoreductase [Alphaproteobacteria bacterium]|nr:SDR family oxidoreductase [Alphaproteobacteria bacterium]
MDLGLKGLKAIVLGGTRGIGRAIADTLAGEGTHVAVCARNGEEVAAALEALSARGVKAFGASVDIADGAALKAWIGTAIESLGGLDILVSNASALAIGTAEDAFAKGFAIDLMGFERAMEAAVPALKTSGKGSVVVISSISGVEVSGPNAYSSIKAAQIPLVKGYALALAKDNVRVNAVSPGTIYFEGGVWGMAKIHFPKAYEDALARNPMGRMGSPQEVANAACFLASPAASFVSGANFIVDGAYTRRVQL